MSAETAVFRGGTGTYPKVVGNGIIALTRRRLIFRMIVGKGVDFPLGTSPGSAARTFRRSVVGEMAPDRRDNRRRAGPAEMT